MFTIITTILYNENHTHCIVWLTLSRCSVCYLALPIPFPKLLPVAFEGNYPHSYTLPVLASHVPYNELYQLLTPIIGTWMVTSRLPMPLRSPVKWLTDRVILLSDFHMYIVGNKCVYKVMYVIASTYIKEWNVYSCNTSPWCFKAQEHNFEVQFLGHKHIPWKPFLPNTYPRIMQLILKHTKGMFCASLTSFGEKLEILS